MVTVSTKGSAVFAATVDGVRRKCCRTPSLGGKRGHPRGHPKNEPPKREGWLAAANHPRVRRFWTC